MSVGIGYDVHRLTVRRRLVLGGVEIPSALGLLGHSDADVLLHAIIDAMLGAASLGDIGQHFPDTDEQYRDISSLRLLEQAHQLVILERYRVHNIDATIIIEKPKLASYLPQMRQNIAGVLDVSLDRVNLKATTNERLGFIGSLDGAAALAVVQLDELVEKR